MKAHPEVEGRSPGLGGREAAGVDPEQEDTTWWTDFTSQNAVK